MSEWKSAGELYDLIKHIDGKERLFDLYGLSLFCDNAFLVDDFQPAPEWCEYVKLTEHGKDYIERLHRSGQKYEPAHEVFVLFQLFYHRDIFIDYLNTDVETILRLLDVMHRGGQARWPYVFGNKLYHKFNDWKTATETDHLDAREVEKLLQDTPQGVFQTGNVVSGPLGFLRSLDQRILMPTLKVPLWHCSDPGCQARHGVTFRGHKSSFQHSRDALTHFILDSFGPPSEWEAPILRLYRVGRWPNGRPYYDLPAIISDCLIAEDRRQLVLRCIQSLHNSFIMQSLRQAGKGQGSPAEIANTLTPEEQHQLLLLLPDHDLVLHIDELVAKRDIRISPAELRRIKTYTFGPPSDTESHLSSLGIRSTGHPPVIELAAAIWQTYDFLRMTDELSWRLRGHEGTTVRHSVIDFIRVHGPQQAVKELILLSRSVVGEVAERYNFTIFPGEDESTTVDRLLWKLGFNLARYEEDYQIFRDRIQEFQNCILQLTIELREEEKAKVRGIGVNLFVSVESFLEDVITYNAWLLSSDHFTGTRFRYAKDDAHRAVVKTLGKEIVSGIERFAWSEHGSNTLGTLITYLYAYRTWLKDRPTADRTILVRKKDDFPHYADDTVWVFPFMHTALWADVASDAMATYIDIVDKLCQQIGQADLSVIRNGLDHKRDDEAFPEPNKMLACASRLQQVVEIADTRRLLPKLFWGKRVESDSHGNMCITFADYRGGTVFLWGPPTTLACLDKSFGQPYLIAPLDFIGQPNSMLLFDVSGRSDYSEYWKNYPRRRLIPPVEVELSRNMNANSRAE